MGDMDMQTTLTFLRSLCTEPEQVQMLNWMAALPPDHVVSFLPIAINPVPREAIP